MFTPAGWPEECNAAKGTLEFTSMRLLIVFVVDSKSADYD